MTISIKVGANGDYVAMVKINGEDAGTVGPGNMVVKDFPYRHGSGPQTYTVEERNATPEEIEAAKPKPAAA